MGIWYSWLGAVLALSLSLGNIPSGTFNDAVASGIFQVPMANIPADNTTWTNFLGGDGLDSAEGVASGINGSTFVSGYSNQTWGSPIRSHSGDSDAFVSKLDASGYLSWNSFLGGSGLDRGYECIADGQGSVYVTGHSDTTWGSPLRGHSGSDDAFIAKLASDGSLSWITFLGGSGRDRGYSLAIDGSGNIFVAGKSDSTWV
jgi:hypothetical protein